MLSLELNRLSCSLKEDRIRDEMNSNNGPFLLLLCLPYNRVTKQKENFMVMPIFTAVGGW